ncbi:hypothetical protein [Gudongella sp. DL1XJH-153]|uniref:hypothetical protein n=1 Tax=Gudongella sp. DL1XJH-153 TaxID=3409804 RepID=UPI003BB69AD8
MNFNYFSYLCFVWAAVGIITRILMITLGDKWNKWEMEHAYSEKKPMWVNIVAGFGIIVVVITWIQVFRLDVDYSWIIAVITTLSLIKISALIFNYEKFREFASETLHDKSKLLRLNISVFAASVIFIALGLFLYS